MRQRIPAYASYSESAELVAHDAAIHAFLVSVANDEPTDRETATPLFSLDAYLAMLDAGGLAAIAAWRAHARADMANPSKRPAMPSYVGPTVVRSPRLGEALVPVQT